MFALSRDRNDLTAGEFRICRDLDRSYEPKVRRAFDEFRVRTEAKGVRERRRDGEADERLAEAQANAGPVANTDETLGELPGPLAVDAPSDDVSARVLAIYRAFGEKVREVMGKGVDLVETDHFLIWTDWESPARQRLADWCEAMYAALCEQFSLDRSGMLFLAKCPVFCWRSKAQFKKFARLFDGQHVDNAIGYTRSIERNGHVHVVLVLPGQSEADFDRFASTLIHEGTHAFLHRLYTTRLIPHWVNEGFADLTAQRVLKERCFYGENAALLAGQYARYGWPIGSFLHEAGPIAVHQYPLAHSIVGYLESLDRRGFLGFIRSLKEGATAETALADNYDHMTLEELENRWRAFVGSQWGNGE
jgi:hypothetical protein